jgi:glycosyltransferase involved in cell wall biosynthesis
LRILYLAADVVPSPKGAAVRIERTVRTMTALGHDVRLLTSCAATGAGLDGIAHETISLPQSNFLARMLAFRRATAAWLEKQSGDLVQCRTIWEGLAAVRWAQARGVPAVFEANGLPSIELPYHYPALFGAPALLEKLIAEEQKVMWAARLIVTPSRTGARYIHSRGVPPERVCVVPNAVDPQLFSPAPVSPSDGTPFRIVYQGTLAPWQGLATLLEALTRYRGKTDVELHVVGPSKSAWRQSLRRLARRCRVHHILHISGATSQQDLVPVLRTAHLCVAPMPADPRNVLQGCCPIKVLEYMAAARPVLATTIPPLLELLEHGRNAFLVRPGSPLDLGDGIEWMLAHPDERERLADCARRDVMARFTPECFMMRISEVLERAVLR